MLLKLVSDQNSKETKKTCTETVKIYYGSKKIMLPSGQFYIYSKPYYCNPELYEKRNEIYNLNLQMAKKNIQYEVIFETDGIEFPYEELDLKEKLTVNEEKYLIKKYASATNDKEAQDALADIWLKQMFCDLVIATQDKKYLSHQIIFCHHSKAIK